MFICVFFFSGSRIYKKFIKLIAYALIGMDTLYSLSGNGHRGGVGLLWRARMQIYLQRGSTQTKLNQMMTMMYWWMGPSR